jgi:hypothetical protein
VAFEPRRGYLYVADSSNDQVIALIIPKISSSSRPLLVLPRPNQPGAARKVR